MQLSDLQTPNGKFTIAAFDHRSSLVEMLGLEKLSEEQKDQAMIQVKKLFLDVFGPISSAILIDPIYGKQVLADANNSTGVLYSLEKSGYKSEKTDVPILVENWGIDGVKAQNAAAKLLLYFHPEESNASQKMEMVQKLYVEAQEKRIPFLLEIVLFDPKNSIDFEHTWHSLQVDVVAQFSQLSDVLKIEYPGLYDTEHAQSLCMAVDEVCVGPWVILSRGMQYDLFQEAVRVSLKSGADGFAVGRAVWQEIEQFAITDDNLWDEQFPKIEQFIKTTGLERMRQLIELVEKS